MAGNPVSKLYEHARKGNLKLEFKDLDPEGPDHNKTFSVRVCLDGKFYPIGMGKKRKDAKLNAAQKALNCLNGLQDVVENSAEASISRSSINYICWLNQYGQRNVVTVTPVETTKPGPQNETEWCMFVVDGKEYPEVCGRTKREAKEKAARLVYNMIKAGQSTDTADVLGQQNRDLNRNAADICAKTGSMSINSVDSSSNFIEIINNYCQKTKRRHSFIEVGRSGPPHNPRFSYRLKIDQKEYPVGEGGNKNEAKQNAARLAWSDLQQQSDYDSKVSVGSAVSEDGAASSSAAAGSSEAPQSPAAAAADSGLTSRSSCDSRDQAENASNVATKSRFISDFEVIARLGKGGFGSVYEVKQKLLDKHFAVKIVRFRDFREARKEVEVLSDLHHPNIVRYFECWVDSEYQDEYRVSSSSSESKSGASKQYLYIMLELCEPVNLGGRIKDMNKEGLEGFGRRRQILPIAQEIVSGVEYFHFKKLIHRDLKPSNIMFGKDGKVKIGDFGLVTTDTSDDDENQMDRTEGAGTKPYMAPEQKSRKYDRKVDMFALGLIFFELLWKISTVTVTEKSKIWTDLRSRKFPEEFVGTFYQEYKIIKSLLSENPEDRQEAAVLQAELKGLISRDSEDQENRTV